MTDATSTEDVVAQARRVTGDGAFSTRLEYHAAVLALLAEVGRLKALYCHEERARRFKNDELVALRDAVREFEPVYRWPVVCDDTKVEMAAASRVFALAEDAGEGVGRGPMMPDATTGVPGEAADVAATPSPMPFTEAKDALLTSIADAVERGHAVHEDVDVLRHARAVLREQEGR